MQLLSLTQTSTCEQAAGRLSLTQKWANLFRLFEAFLLAVVSDRGLMAVLQRAELSWPAKPDTC